MRLPGLTEYKSTNSFYLWWPLWWFPATKIVAWTTMKLKMNFQFFMLVAFGKKDSSWKKTFKTILKFLGLISNFHILFFLNLNGFYVQILNRAQNPDHRAKKRSRDRFENNFCSSPHLPKLFCFRDQRREQPAFEASPCPEQSLAKLSRFASEDAFRLSVSNATAFSETAVGAAFPSRGEVADAVEARRPGRRPQTKRPRQLSNSFRGLFFFFSAHCWTQWMLELCWGPISHFSPQPTHLLFRPFNFI